MASSPIAAVGNLPANEVAAGVLVPAAPSSPGGLGVARAPSAVVL